MITLKKVTHENFDEIIKLQVTDLQKSHVASNLYSIAQTKVYEQCHSVGIYLDDTPIGYMMYGRDMDDDNQPPWLVRFMVDSNHQNKGYGKIAFRKLMDFMHETYPHEDIFLSTAPDNDYVIAFYEKEGFESTGKIENDELVFVLKSKTKSLRNEVKDTVSKLLNKELEIVNVEDIVSKMMIFIGDTESEFRDEMILELFYEIIHSNQMSKEALIHLLKELWSDAYLFKHIKKETSDFVFKRSFSALVFAEIIRYHKKHHILDHKMIEEAVIKAIEYLIAETDERGYVDIKGWAHATAHGADVLRNLSELDELTHLQIEMILDSVVAKLNQLKYAFTAQEDERLSLIYLKLLERGISESLVNSYLSKMIDQIKNMDIIKKQNTKSFLKAIRDRLMIHNIAPDVISHINHIIQKIVRY
jgi:diamine N-acetyltransferase